MGIPVLLPDINESAEDFSVESGGIRFGLSAVKNVGTSAASAIVEARKKEGSFRPLRHLATAADLKSINRRVLESLVMGGAMDSLGGHRAQLLAGAARSLEGGLRVQRDRERGQASLFGEAEVEVVSESLPDVEPWSDEEAMRQEREALGFYLSSHPLDHYRAEIETCSTAAVSALRELGDSVSVRLGGILTAVKTTLDRKGNQMAFATLEDLTGKVELLVFSDPYGKYQPLIRPESPILVTGRTTCRENEEPKVIVGKVVSLSGTLDEIPATVHLRIEAGRLDDGLVHDLERLVEKYPGNSRILFHLVAEDRGEVEMGVREKRIAPKAEVVEALRQLVGERCAWVEKCSVDDWA